MMKLIGTNTSPYTRKVRVVLAEKRMECEFAIDAPNTEGSTIAQYNPLGKIPVLVLDDESTLFDSRVIVEYLDNASPGNRLIPEEKRPRIQVRRWEALADGCTDAAIAVVMEKRRPAEQQLRPRLLGIGDLLPGLTLRRRRGGLQLLLLRLLVGQELRVQ